MTIEDDKPKGCIGCAAYVIVYGLVALGFWKVLEIIWGAIA